MPDLAARLLEEHGVAAAPASLASACRLGFTYKKSPDGTECGRADIRDERRVWTGQRQARMREQPHRLVFCGKTFTTRR